MIAKKTMTNYAWLVASDNMPIFIMDILSSPNIDDVFSKYKIPCDLRLVTPQEAVMRWFGEEHRETGIYVKRDGVIAALQTVRFPGIGEKKKYTRDEVRSIIVENVNKWISEVNELDIREFDE